jgi:signal transduction histidine kinase
MAIMNRKKTIKNEFAPNKVCPVTGLRVLQRPEWTDVNFSKGCRVTLSVVGDSILLVQSVGYAGLDDVKGTVSLIRSVRTKAIPGNRPYIQIDDFSNLRSTSVKGRKYYIEYMEGRERLSGLIFYGTSVLLRVSIKLAKKIHMASFDVEIVKDYPDAIRLAQKLLGGGRTVSRPAAASNGDGLHHQAVINSHWRVQDKNFSLKFEILRGNVLHGVTTGKLESKHIAPSSKLQENITKTIFSPDRPYSFILGVDKSEGTGQKARKLYYDAILALYKNYPFRIFIFYGAKKFVKAGINLYKPFVPFKVRVVKDLAGALKLIVSETSKVKASREKLSEPDRLKQYVNEVLQSIDEINWEPGSIGGNKEKDPSHPFSPVFEAIDLIKWELDELFQKQHLTMENLEDAYEELKGAQAQLVQSAKLASIGELASGVAHELNQPLMVIRGNTQVILRNLRKNNLDYNDLMERLAPIERNTKRMMNIINHLRTFSRQPQFELKPVEVNKTLEDAFLMLDEQLRLRNIEVKKHFAPDLPKVDADSNRLEQVFLNLITNARDAILQKSEVIGRRSSVNGKKSENRGRLEIITRMGEVDNHQSQNFVEILVRDNGGGIPSENMEKIFDPFFSTKEVGKGTGLGLSISYGIIKDHQGEISVAETSPAGTTFRIKLPIED